MKKLAFLFLFLLLLSGCGTQRKQSAQFFAMDTIMDLTVYGNHPENLQQASELIFSLEHSLSVTDPESELYGLNQEHSAVLSGPAADLLQKALHFCEKTDGCLDISIYPVVKAWGFTTGSHQIPSSQKLQSLLASVDYREIRMNGNSVTLPKTMEIDLGSVAKGFAGDRILSLMQDQGVTSALLNLGGNVQALGKKPDGSPFQIGIQDPNAQGYLGVLSIENEAVITSGGYQRYFVGEDGNTYWHILDPATGYPARNGLISATAVGPEGAYCDALSTALFIMGPEKAQNFWRQYRDFEMILVTDQHRVLITPGLSHRFTLAEGSQYLEEVISDD